VSKFDYDLFVIGAGSGGVRAGRLAAQLGQRVAVAEESKPGMSLLIGHHCATPFKLKLIACLEFTPISLKKMARRYSESAQNLLINIRLS